MRFASPHLLAALAVFCLSACKSFEYEADAVHIEQNSIHVANVGFKGFALSPPDSFELLSHDQWSNSSSGSTMESLQASFQNSEGLDYHFHQDFVFRKGEQLLYFVPFQLKPVHKFRFTPPDIQERFLIDWARRAEFAKIIDYDLKWRTESNKHGHSTIILSSKAPQNGWVYEERIMTGDLKEMFIFAGFARADEAEALSAALGELQGSLEVIR